MRFAVFHATAIAPVDSLTDLLGTALLTIVTDSSHIFDSSFPMIDVVVDT